MARKPTKKDEANERSIDIDHLEPDLRKKAHNVGCRKRISLNKVARTLEHERRGHKLAMGFVYFMSAATLIALVLRFAFTAEERRGQMLMVVLFAGAWGALSFVYARRAKKREHMTEEVLAYVQEKLGR